MALFCKPNLCLTIVRRVRTYHINRRFHNPSGIAVVSLPKEEKEGKKKPTVLLSAPTEAAWSKEQFKPAVKLGYLPLNNRRTITQ